MSFTGGSSFPFTPFTLGPGQGSFLAVVQRLRTPQSIPFLPEWSLGQRIEIKTKLDTEEVKRCTYVSFVTLFMLRKY